MEFLLLLCISITCYMLYKIKCFIIVLQLLENKKKVKGL